MASDFYLRYYVGHKGKFGHEFLEFEFRPDGESGAGAGGGGRAAGGGAGGPRVPPAWFNARPLPTGKLRYANNSNYKNDVMIRKEVRARGQQEGSGQGSGLAFLVGRLVFISLPECCVQAYVHKSVMEELKRIIDDSEITKEDDALWPPPDRVGRQVGCACLF